MFISNKPTKDFSALISACGNMIKEDDEKTDKEDAKYKEFFASALKKFGVSSPGDFESEEKKKEFFDYVDKNWKGKSEEIDLALYRFRTGDMDLIVETIKKAKSFVLPVLEETAKKAKNAWTESQYRQIKEAIADRKKKINFNEDSSHEESATDLLKQIKALTKKDIADVWNLAKGSFSVGVYKPAEEKMLKQAFHDRADSLGVTLKEGKKLTAVEAAASFLKDNRKELFESEMSKLKSFRPATEKAFYEKYNTIQSEFSKWSTSERKQLLEVLFTQAQKQYNLTESDLSGRRKSVERKAFIVENIKTEKDAIRLIKERASCRVMTVPQYKGIIELVDMANGKQIGIYEEAKQQLRIYSEQVGLSISNPYKYDISQLAQYLRANDFSVELEYQNGTVRIVPHQEYGDSLDDAIRKAGRTMFQGTDSDGNVSDLNIEISDSQQQ